MSQTAGVVGCTYNTGGAKELACTQVKVDQFLLEWLSLEDTQALVASLSECAPSAARLQEAGDGGQSLLIGAPPLSPRTTSPRSHFSPRRQLLSNQEQFVQTLIPPLTGQQVQVESNDTRNEIPRFYFPGYKSRKIKETARTEIMQRIATDFQGQYMRDGLGLEKFVRLSGEILGLSEVLGIVLFWKLQGIGNGVGYAELTGWMERKGYIGMNQCERTFEILKSDDSRNYLIEEDLHSMVKAALEYHPGLEFLKSSPEFQKRYEDTVVFRILYDLGCRPEYDRIYLRSLRHNQKLLGALQMLDDDEEVNRELNYFSYEHFYVIYCKFWELDQDQDMLLKQDDLLIYGSCALTYQITSRIFQGAPKELEGNQPGTMSYKDFVWFILSEEDKNSETAIDYWFRCIDLDGDGYINDHEVKHFYGEQYSRMECMNQETIKVEDVLAQLSDMLKPASSKGVKRQDLQRQGRLASSFFDMLFNVHKFWTLENQDPFTAKQERGDSDMTDWQLFAAYEYARMMMEEDFPSNNM